MELVNGLIAMVAVSLLVAFALMMFGRNLSKLLTTANQAIQVAYKKVNPSGF